MRLWLKTKRKGKRLSQSKVAKLVGVDVTAISKYELGSRRPSPEIAKRIADALGFDWTLFFENEPH